MLANPVICVCGYVNSLLFYITISYCLSSQWKGPLASLATMHLIGNSEVRKNPSAVGNPTSSGFSSAQFGLLWMSSWTFQGYFIVWYQCRWQCRKHCCKSWIFIFSCNCLWWQLFLGTVFFSQYNEVEAITTYRMTYIIYKQYTSVQDIWFLLCNRVRD